jgi:ATP-dependent DNA ligase
VNTYQIDNVNKSNVEVASEISGYIHEFISEEYEGAVIRLGNGLYTFGYNTKRSDSNFKVKQRFDTEFRVVGFTEGTKGKEVGAIIWILANKDGKQFNVVPKSEKGSKGVIEQRKQLYKELIDNPKKFNDEYKDRMMTVEFEDYSEDGLPQRAKAIGIRHDI